MTTQITQNNNQNTLHIDSDCVRCFILEVLRFFRIQTDEVIINFISEDKMKLLHGLFFNNTETTDCISFPMEGTTEKKPGVLHILGECFINPQEAVNYNPEKPYEEVSRYIIHCILHFIGYKDYTKKDKDEMHILENKALNHTKKKKVLLTNPLPLYT